MDHGGTGGARPALVLAAAAAVVAAGIGLIVATNHGTGMATHAELWFLHFGDAPSAEIVDVDAGTRRTVPVTGLPTGGWTGAQDVVRLGNSLIVLHNPGDPEPYSAYAIAPDGSARSLGRANTVLRSTVPGRVWLVTVGTGAQNSREPTTVREVDFLGQEVTAPQPVPPGFSPAGVTAEGLVGEQYIDGTGGRLLLWDPVTSRTTRTFAIDKAPSLLAAGNSVVVWSQNRDGQGIHLTDTATGHDRVLESPAGLLLIGSGTLSPDGSTLVMLATTKENTTPQTPRTILMAAVDVPTGKASPLSGRSITRVNEGFGWNGPGWSADGTTLFFTTLRSNGGEVPVYAYRRGGTSISTIQMNLGPFEASGVGVAP